MAFRTLNRLQRWWRRRGLSVWYDPKYRLPLAGLEGTVGMEPRRADFVAWYLLERRVIAPTSLRAPKPVAYADLARVHDHELLDQLASPTWLARIFAAAPEEVPVDEILHTVRLVCGGTLGAARETLQHGHPALNLLGGFHHAGKRSAGGFCPVNDVAVAIATLRAEGFSGQVVVLDLDAHPPDGTADCLQDDPKTWIGSISGSHWAPMPRVDETLLPKGAGDSEYLAALEALLLRMPKPELAFVLAGGDVLARDRFGLLALTLDGVRQRDLRVAEALERVPSVWVPAGGYNERAWLSLAGTGLALALRSRRPISQGYDPLSARFSLIASGLDRTELGAQEEMDGADIEAALGLRRRGPKRLLGYYTKQGVEYALYRYGVLEQLGRLGYGAFRVELDEVDQGDRMRLFGQAGGAEHLLVECVVEKRRIDSAEVLYIHWLTLRHPRAAFETRRPRLPGQDVPGLGMARESGAMLARMAERLELQGVAFRPAWFHMAYAARYRFRFVDPARQGRFEALVRDLGRRPLLEVTLAVAEGRVRMNGAPYTWEADEMVFWHEPRATDADAVRAERERVHFTLESARPPSPEQQASV